MLDTVITLIIPFFCASLALWGSVFYEKEGWRKAASAGLALSVDKVMPTVREM